ncbi:MAG TPA: glycoside hydrolase family 78 protein [Candidatus Mediterraneibacter cottocaccae]|nr:glycoside hydrolase family 78 protein [Candidatus Mediterraneibacter cottocaccae]
MLKINRLKVNGMTCPYGISGCPQFGWEIETDKRGMVQKSFRLQISLSEDFQFIVYDSGEISSGESLHFQPEGWLPEPAKKYYVRVKISDNNEESTWSSTSHFVTSLKEGTWDADFITAETDDTYQSRSAGTYIKGNFLINGKVREAYVYTTALGLYNFYLNGRKVGLDELTPGWTSYRRNLLYQTYEVTGLIEDGPNTAGAMLAPGWYRGVMGLTHSRNNYGTKTAFSMHLVVCFEDGSTQIITSDSSWTGCDSPVISSGIYEGETYNAALEIPDWSVPGSNTGEWHGVQKISVDPDIIHPQEGARVTAKDRLPAQKLFTTPEGDLVADFGQNMTGRIQVTASGKPGDVIEIQCFEVLDKDGNVYLDNLRQAKQTMKYIFAEEKQITWHPAFTYMGFRYARIISWPGIPAREDLTAYTLYSDMELTGSLETSEPLLNQLHHNILWGMKSNFLDVPTDCPQRDERLGWTADAQIFSRTASYLMNTDIFFRKWLRDLSADQLPDGGVPHVIPNIEEGKEKDNWLLSQIPHSAAAWADAAVIIPWNLYLMFEDLKVLETQYESMKKWIDFMYAHSENYIWSFYTQLGDWVALDAEEGSYFGATPTDLICTAYFAYSTGLTAKTAELLGKDEDARKYRALEESIIRQFHKTYFDQNGAMTAQTQTAHIVALHFGLVPENLISRTAERLCQLLEENNGHLLTGFVGTPYFCFALSETGHVQKAYDLLLKDDFPSWLYQVKMGATTVWEHWDGLKPDGSMWSPDMNSFNHYAYGAVGEWMYRVMAGIDTDEDRAGFRHSIIYPRFGRKLSFVKGHYHSGYGLISSEWTSTGSKITLEVDIPPNTTATIRLDRAKSVLNGDGLHFRFVPRSGYAEAEAGSGHYTIDFVICEYSGTE